MYLTKETKQLLGGKKMDNGIDFWITEEQAEVICRHFGKERELMADYEIAELLDVLIDEANDEF